MSSSNFLQHICVQISDLIKKAVAAHHTCSFYGRQCPRMPPSALATICPVQCLMSRDAWQRSSRLASMECGGTRNRVGAAQKLTWHMRHSIYESLLCTSSSHQTILPLPPFTTNSSRKSNPPIAGICSNMPSSRQHLGLAWLGAQLSTKHQLPLTGPSACFHHNQPYTVVGTTKWMWNWVRLTAALLIGRRG